jgi:hypothetical protein
MAHPDTQPWDKIISRVSLITDLETRYATHKAGSAFDAHAAGIKGGSNNPVDNSKNDAAVGFILDKKNQLMVSDFKDWKNGNSGLSGKIGGCATIGLTGFSNKKYKP